MTEITFLKQLVQICEHYSNNVEFCQVVRLLTQGELTGGEVEAVWSQVMKNTLIFPSRFA
jgi:hypothetical protein